MRRRCLLLLALTGNPEVLMLDEPFQGLDSATVETVTRMLVESVQDNDGSDNTHNAKSSGRELENNDKDGAKEGSRDAKQPTTDNTNQTIEACR